MPTIKNPTAPKDKLKFAVLEHLKKNGGHVERGFWGLGEALAKAQV
jgi:hypothetical protein